MSARILRTAAAVDYICQRTADPSAPRPYSIPKLIAGAKAGTVPVLERDGRGFLFSTAQIDLWLAGEWKPAA